MMNGYNDTETITVRVIHLAEDKYASKTDIDKINYIISFGLDKIEQLLASIKESDAFSKLELKSFISDRFPTRDAASIQVEIQRTADTKMTASANGFYITMTIPDATLAAIPSEAGSARLDRNQTNAFELVLNHFIHEFCHVFGAYHAKDGIMSGVIQLFEDDENGVDINGLELAPFLDDHTVRIVSETLKATTFAQSNAYYEYFESERRVSFTANNEIKSIFILNNNAYTDHFYYVSDDNFSCHVPDDSGWDAILVQFAYGTLMYFKQRAIFNNGHGEADRIRVF